MASTTTITFVTPDSEAAVNSRIRPTVNGKDESINRIAQYLEGVANGSIAKTSLTITIGNLSPVVL